MKDKKLQKHLIIYASILLVLVASALTGIYFTSSYNEKNISQLSRIKMGITSANRQIVDIRKKSDKVLHSIDLYNQLTKGDDSIDLRLSRKNAVKVLDKLKHDYKLGSVILKMAPVKEIQDKFLQKKNGNC